MTLDENKAEGYLTGQLLIAMPAMRDQRFARSVIYICAHNQDGAMGLVLNRLVGAISFPEMLAQIGITGSAIEQDIPVHFGGPMETGRGFVLHSGEYLQESSLKVTPEVALTATVDILRDIASGEGPRRRLFALGYAGWAPGQLDAEIQENGWLSVTGDEELIFDENLDEKWERALAKLGVTHPMLSGEAGHA